MVPTQVQRRVRDVAAAIGNAPPARARDLAYLAVCVKAKESSGRVSTPPFIVFVGGRQPKVPEPDCQEHPFLAERRRSDRCHGPHLRMHGLCKAVHHQAAFARATFEHQPDVAHETAPDQQLERVCIVAVP